MRSSRPNPPSLSTQLPKLNDPCLVAKKLHQLQPRCRARAVLIRAEKLDLNSSTQKKQLFIFQIYITPAGGGLLLVNN